jgi:predicted dehydrogenase
MSGSTSTSPVRIGVVGCGGSRQTYGPAIAALPQARITALMDVDILSARLWARKVRAARAYCDFDEFLADAPVDAVIVASPSRAREEQIAALLRAGKNVLAETPPANRVSGSLQLADQAAQAVLLLCPALLLRFDPVIREARTMIRNGAIGALRELRCEWAFSSAWAQRKAVLQTWSGILMQHALRTFDLARWWLGEAHSVSADIDPATSSGKAGNMANVIVQHEMGVSVHHIYRTSHRARFERYIATGSAGVMEITSPAAGALDGSSLFRISVRTNGEDQVAERTDGYDASKERSTSHRALVAAFIGALASGRPMPVSAFDAAAAQAILEAALVSSQEGLKVTVAPLERPAIGSGE